ncbi:MAG: sulfotransferase [Actinomycetota bacterium]|nr:sulfotransferase [Actinomycetota bacterium]
MSHPSFFLIGAARSGTTALAEILRRHPEIFVTHPKEPHFLAFAGRTVRFSGPGDDTSINRVAVTDEADYLRLYEHAGSKPARGDASVSTLYYPQQSLETLERLFPAARLVVILRNPTDRAFSNYQYLRTKGFESCPDFRQALELEDERMAKGWHHLWHYKKMGFYGHQLTQFVERLGYDRLLVLFYDHFNDQPHETIRHIFRFLDVDPDAPIQGEQRINVSGSVRNRSLQTLIQAGSRHHYIKTVIRILVPYRIRERIRAANLREAQLPQDTRLHLDRLYEDDLIKLKRLVEMLHPSHRQPLPKWLTSRQ